MRPQRLNALKVFLTVSKSKLTFRVWKDVSVLFTDKQSKMEVETLTSIFLNLFPSFTSRFSILEVLSLRKVLSSDIKLVFRVNYIKLKI